MTNGVQMLEGTSGSQNYYAFLNQNISLLWSCIDVPHFIKNQIQEFALFVLYKEVH
jgi:hypothetical protein